MKCELENIKPQQYPRQNITDMSLHVTYHCQALTTAGIWDHQLCSSILSAFLLADGDEMYHHSLITMKATFMEYAAGTNHLGNKGLTYADIGDLGKTQYQEAKGVGKWPPATHTKTQGTTIYLYLCRSSCPCPVLSEGSSHLQAPQLEQ